MMSLRSAARSAPRTLARLTNMTARRSPSSAASLLRSPFTSLRPQVSASAFSTSVFRRAAAQNEVDEELSAKLQTEIQFETEAKDIEMQPSSIKDFLDGGLFEVEDIAGQQDVILRRTYGSEKITITFSIGDLANYDPEMFDEDAALADEELDGERSPAQDGRSAEEADDLDRANDAAVPCQLSIVIEKPNGGALSIDATAQDGNLLVNNMYYYADAALAHGKTADQLHAADAAYPGPPFGSLDEDLQVLIERYLEERGITQALAVFVPDYMDAKEQREYLAWLNSVKGFIDA